MSAILTSMSHNIPLAIAVLIAARGIAAELRAVAAKLEAALPGTKLAAAAKVVEDDAAKVETVTKLAETALGVQS